MAFLLSLLIIFLIIKIFVSVIIVLIITNVNIIFLFCLNSQKLMHFLSVLTILF